MTQINIQELLEPISPDEPCGENLEYDAAFMELGRLAAGTPDQQVGDSVVAGEEPDWRAANNSALELFSRTKDLRVGVILAQAQLQLNGFVGFAAAMDLLAKMLDGMWPTVHPQLDEDDDDDPTERINSLITLCDANAMLNPLRLAPLVTARGLGDFNLRDVLVATGEMDAVGVDKPVELSTVDGAFMGAELDDLQATYDALTSAGESVKAMLNTFMGMLGPGYAPDMSKLRQIIERAARAVEKRLTARGAGQADEAAEGEEGEDGGGGGGGGGGRAAPLSGEISNREQVTQALDKICAYYARYEPGSPVPLLVGRVKKLINASFIDIMADLAPDAVDGIKALGGRSEEEEE